MKKLYFLCMLLAMSIAWACSTDTPDEIKKSGSIAGSVSDRTTGEPISAVSVTIEPGGASTVTGTDGSFTFRNLEIGSYTLTAKKEGYKENSSTVSVRAGEPISAHMLIERIPDIVTADRDLLDYGDNPSTNTLSFNIVNAGFENLTWEIEEHCEWITEVKPEKGTLAYGKTEAIVVVIDRDLLAAGNNEAVIVIKSSKGSSEVKVVAVGAERFTPALNTLEATDITSQSAKLNAEITNPGEPAYTERGFVYSLNSMPTFDNMLAKLTAPVNEETKYSYSLNGLTLGKKYYVRAYAINSVGTAYSTNEISFTPIAHSPELTIQPATDLNVTKASATLNGTVVKEGDPAYFERGFVYSTESTPTVNNVKQKANSVSKKTTNTRLSRLESANHSALGSYANNKFDLGLATNSNLSSVTVKANGTGTGTFRVNVTGLDLNKRYYVRAYAICKVNDSEVIVYSKEETTFSLATTPPSVSMESVTNQNVSARTATLNGKVTEAGNPVYTEKGFVYSESPSPTTKNKKISVEGKSIGNYSVNITDLDQNKTYYVRAYAINKINDSEVIVYSKEEITFSLATTPPSVSMESVTNQDISARTATLNGKVTEIGNPVYEEKGFVYSESPSPTINDKKIPVEGKSAGNYSVTVTNLDLNKTYYVRAYIKRNEIYYSSETVNLTLSTTAPKAEMISVTDKSYSSKMAKFTGKITDSGNPAYTKRGFVFGFNSNPIVENDRSVIVTGSGSNDFSINVSDLVVNKKYFVRVFTEQEGKYYYSAKELDFTLQPVAASVGSTSVSEVDMNSAMLTSTIISVGDPGYTEKGFVYNTTGNPSITQNTGKVTANGHGEGQFSSRISSLISNGVYYARAYVIQNGNTYYGAEISFKTSKQAPVVATNGASNIMYTSATLNATVTSVGDPAYNKRGFYYGTSSNPTAANSTTIVEDASSFGDYSRNITGLSEKTTYYYRAFLLQPGDSNPILGQVSSFKTGHAPNVTTGQIVNITCSGSDENNLQWSCTISGGLSDNGDPAYTEFGFVYGTTPQPTVDDGVSTYTTTTKYDEVNYTRIFSKIVSGLSTGQHYYFRAVAKTPLGYVYGEQTEFTPAVIAPAIRTYSTECRYLDSANGWAVAFVGVAGSLGQPAATGMGFVYGTDTNPTVGDGSSIAVTYTKIEQENGYYVFGAAVGGLIAKKNYYVRAYAKTQLGYTYGEVMTFKTY